MNPRGPMGMMRLVGLLGLSLLLPVPVFGANTCADLLVENRVGAYLVTRTPPPEDAVVHPWVLDPELHQMDQYWIFLKQVTRHSGLVVYEVQRPRADFTLHRGHPLLVFQDWSPKTHLGEGYRFLIFRRGPDGGVIATFENASNGLSPNFGLGEAPTLESLLAADFIAFDASTRDGKRGIDLVFDPMGADAIAGRFEAEFFSAPCSDCNTPPDEPESGETLVEFRMRSTGWSGVQETEEEVIRLLSKVDFSVLSDTAVVWALGLRETSTLGEAVNVSIKFSRELSVDEMVALVGKAPEHFWAKPGEEVSAKSVFSLRGRKVLELAADDPKSKGIVSISTSYTRPPWTYDLGRE